MLLAADHFEAVLASLPVQPASIAVTTGGGQRQGPRVAVAGRLIVIPYAPGAQTLVGYDFPRDAQGSPMIPLGNPQSVPLRDLSRGGVRFLMPRRLPLDTPFILLLPRLQPSSSATAEPAAPIAIECTVSYWQPVRRELFAIGSQFLRVLQGFVPPAIAPTLVLPELDMHSALHRSAS